jgi:hypothetical protein
MSSSSLWQRFQQHFLYYRDLGFSLDINWMNSRMISSFCLLGGQTDSNEAEELQKDKVGDLIGS